MITEAPTPLLVLIGIVVTLGIVTVVLLEIRLRMYGVTSYLLWAAALTLALLGFTQEAVMIGVTMFFAAFVLIIISGHKT